MTQEGSMDLDKLLLELTQIYGLPENIRKKKHRPFDSETLEFIVNNSIQMIMQFVDESFTAQGHAFPGVSGEEYADLALFVREIPLTPQLCESK